MEVPAELRPHLEVEVDPWHVWHIVCLRCRRKFFTVADAARHVYNVHGIKAAQRYLENI